MLSSWLPEFLRRLSSPFQRGQRKAARPKPDPFRPVLEILEDRTVLSTVNWVGGSGAWSDSSHWFDTTSMTNHVPGAADDAVINLAGVSVTHGAGTDTANSLAVTDATLILSDGTLNLSTLSGSGTFNLAGGTLGNATVASGSTITGTNSGGTLSNVTLIGTLDIATGFGYATVINGLTLNGTANLGNSGGDTTGYLYFSGTQTLDGTGSVVFGASINNGLYFTPGSIGTTLTIGADVTVHGQTGYLGYYGTSCTLVNQGTISADIPGGTIYVQSNTLLSSGNLQASSGGTLNLAGAWSNSGTITVNSGTVNLGGTVNTTDLGTFSRSGGTVNLAGTLNNAAATLALSATTGSWQLFGGTISGGTVTEADGARLLLTNSGGTLTGVTLSNDLDGTTNFGFATVTTGLTLNGTANLGNSGGDTTGYLYFSGTQTLGGTGSVVFGASINNGLYFAPGSIGTTLTIGADVTVHGQTGYLGYYGTSCTLVNQGTISADTPGGTIYVSNTNWSSSGSLQARNGGTLNSGAFSNAGTVTIGIGSTLTASNFTQTGGTTTLTGGTLSATSLVNIQAGTLAGMGTINADVQNAGLLMIGDITTPGILTINGNYTQTSAGTLALKVGGFATAGADFDQLVLTAGHQAMLDGTLNVTLINGYTPTSGDSVTVMTFDSETGTFTALTGDGSLFTPNYDPTDVTLVAN